jgi:hypothetical protein
MSSVDVDMRTTVAAERDQRLADFRRTELPVVWISKDARTLVAMNGPCARRYFYIERERRWDWYTEYAWIDLDYRTGETPGRRLGGAPLPLWPRRFFMSCSMPRSRRAKEGR